MKSFVWLFGAVLTAFVLFTGSKSASPPVGEEYQRAVAAAKQALQDHHYNQATLTLVALQKTLTGNEVNRTLDERTGAQLGGQWKVEFLDKSCLNNKGLRTCKGGGVVVTVNLLTSRAEVQGLE